MVMPASISCQNVGEAFVEEIERTVLLDDLLLYEGPVSLDSALCVLKVRRERLEQRIYPELPQTYLPRSLFEHHEVLLLCRRRL